MNLEKYCRDIEKQKPPEKQSVFLPCPHTYIHGEIINRNLLSQDQHTALLATPKGYRWNKYSGLREPREPFKLKKNKRKDKCGKGSPLVITDQRYISDFLSDIWNLMTPTLIEKLKKILKDEFGMTEKQAAEFIEEQKMRNTFYTGDRPKERFNLNERHEWVRDMSKMISGKLSDYLEMMMGARRTKRVKLIAETILKNLCKLSGEKCGLQEPKNRVHQFQVFTADRLAIWLAELFPLEQDKICKAEVMGLLAEPDDDDDDGKSGVGGMSDGQGSQVEGDTGDKKEGGSKPSSKGVSKEPSKGALTDGDGGEGADDGADVVGEETEGGDTTEGATTDDDGVEEHKREVEPSDTSLGVAGTEDSEGLETGTEGDESGGVTEESDEGEGLGEGDEVKEKRDPLDHVMDWIEKTSKEETPRQQAIQELVEKELHAELKPTTDKAEKILDVVSGKVATWIDQRAGEGEANLTGMDKAGGPPFMQTGVTFRIKKTEEGSYYTVKKLDSMKNICDRTLLGRAQRTALAPTAICRRPSNPCPLKTPKDVKEWATWASNVVSLAEKWASWIDRTCGEAEAKAKDVELGHLRKRDWKKWQRDTETGAMEWRRNKKHVKQTALIWEEKMSQKTS